MIQQPKIDTNVEDLTNNQIEFVHLLITSLVIRPHFVQPSAEFSETHRISIIWGYKWIIYTSNSYLFIHCSIDCCEDYISPLGDVSGNVLGINIDPAGANENEIQLQPKDESSSDVQKWVRDQDVGNGWFPLKNPNSGKILSAINESSLVARGKYKSVMWVKV